MSLPARIPVFPLTGAILLPGARLPLNIFEPRYLDMVRDALAGPGLIGMIQPSNPTDQSFEPPVYDIGCAGRIIEHQETPDGRILIVLSGLSRFTVAEELERDTLYRQVIADYRGFEADLEPDAEPALARRETLIATLKAFLDQKGLKADWQAAAQAPDDALVNALAMMLPLTPAEKQALVEAPRLADRADALIALLGMASLEGDDGGAPVQ